MTQKNRKKIGLVLGSGGVKGLSHIGVIKVLLENGIPIDFIAGSSIGAAVGAAYSADLDCRRMQEIVLKTDWRNAFYLLDPAFSGGIIRGSKIEDLINNWIGVTDFSDLKIPFAAVATDLVTGEPVILEKGDLIKAVRASMSIPPVFSPLQYENRLLADGGLSNPLPDDVLKEMGADIIITVNLDGGNFAIRNHFGSLGRISISRISIRALNIVRHHLAKNVIRATDVMIEPNVAEIGLVGWKKFFDKNKSSAIIREGEKAAGLAIPKIKKIIN